MKLKIATALCAVLTLPACATVTRGTNTAWEVTSTPPGARVETSNGHMCQATPCSIRMPRRSEFIATLTLEGYQPATVTVTNKVATGGGVAMAGNVLVGGIIGAGVDAGSGAMLDLTPNPAHVELRPE
jgi:septum formation inhibitor MinC